MEQCSAEDEGGFRCEKGADHSGRHSWEYIDDYVARLERELALVNARVNKVRDAIRVPGPSPTYHQSQMRRLREAWPVLWFAIQELINVPG